MVCPLTCCNLSLMVFRSQLVIQISALYKVKNYYLMANQLVFTLMILPNILQLLSKYVFKFIYGYSVQIVLITVLIYSLNFFIISYFLHKWFVKGEGDIKQQTKDKIKKVIKKWQQLTGYLDQSNMHVLIRVYISLAMTRMLYQIIPGILFTFFFCIIADFYESLTTYFKNNNIYLIQLFKQWWNHTLRDILHSIPKYKSLRVYI